MSAIKAVVYDFGGVLLSYEQVVKKWEEMSIELGLAKEIVQYETISTGFSEWLGPNRSLFLGTLTADEIENGLFLDYLKQKYGDQIKNDNVNLRVYSSILRGDNVIYYPEMMKTVEMLRENGIKTAILTNNLYLDEAKQEERVPIDHSLFDVIVESCVEGKMKPDPMFYKICEDRLNVKPDEIVFLDDQSVNTDVADKLGWKTIVVKDIKEAVKQLEDITNIKLQ